MERIIAETKNGKLIEISYRGSPHFLFSCPMSDRKLLIECSNFNFNVKLHPLVRFNGIKKLFFKENVKDQRKRLNKEKRFLIDHLYKQMLKNKQFIPLSFVRYNNRYNKEFNYYSLAVSYELLDAKHIFLKIMYSNFFNYNWKYFFDNYDRLEYHLKNNLSARQMLISFVSEHGKINKLWKNKKFKWIIQETPYFYLKALRVIRYLSEDNLKKFYDYSQSIYRNNNTFDFNRSNSSLSATPFFNRKLKKKFCKEKKSKYEKRKVIIKVGNGILNSTMNVVNLFNNKPTEIFIASSNSHHQIYSELYDFIFLINNVHLKFISTNSSFIMHDTNNIIIPNMKYATRMLRNFEKQVFNFNKYSSLEVCEYIEKFIFYLDRIKSKRTRRFIKIRLEDIYIRYKLG